MGWNGMESGRRPEEWTCSVLEVGEHRTAHLWKQKGSRRARNKWKLSELGAVGKMEW
jgi:hypothetical protein